MYNRVILVGNLTRDIDLRYTPSGTAVGKVGIATNRRFKGANGETKDETMFIDLTFFGRTAEIANQYLSKGSKILVEGRLVLEQWTAQDGTRRSKHSVTVDTMQMIGSRQDGQHHTATAPNGATIYTEPANRPENPNSSRPAAAPEAPDIPGEDEIPF
jgi:single-strand DNA-binding protein